MNKPSTSEQSHKLPWQSETTRFWWVRHAPVTHLKHVMYGNTDVEADVSELAKFRSLASRLPEQAIWYTSQLQRTHQTADGVEQAGLIGKQRLESPLIAEMDFGDRTGKTHEQLIKERSDPYAGFWPISPVEEQSTGESMQDTCNRVAEFVERCTSAHAGEDIVCFSHMGTILAALTNALSLDLHNSVCFSIDNLTITQISHYADLHHEAPRFRVFSVAEKYHDSK